ncbi:hypothetical protein TGAMA5MH_02249 [Trichoderma gamsii]|uniref:DUF7779 domain-containing protein n=1 Tax=Trichoderma gamsii TaxID=398673 RepID=A0A2K0TL17_9HYPO|nr:hypothetical protein TGAMA5MH_02249 [Trichoderma gamsii]
MILADYWPQGSGSILITSRNPLAKGMFTRRPLGLNLAPLSKQDSLTLFSHLTSVSNEPDRDTARKITDVLGGVPLAISQMAGIIHVIGEDLLMAASIKLFSDGLQFKKSNCIEARSELLQSSLVYRDKQMQQVSVHRLVQDTILTTMDDEKTELMFGQVARILWGDWPSAMPKPSKDQELPKPKSTGSRLHVARWSVCASIYPHVLRMHQLWSSIPNISDATNVLFAKLLNEAAWYQKERGRTKHFDGLFDTALSICESLSHAELGISRIQDNRYEEGEAHLKEALRIRKALGNYIPRSGEANLSWSLLAQGKLEECNALLLDSLAGREKALGKDDRESVPTGLILYALGNLRAAQDNWDESSEYHQRALRHMLATVGEKDFYTANFSHKVAEHFIRLHRNEEAIAMINGALDIRSVDPAAHRNEIARTTFLKGKLFEATGKAQKVSIALRVACRLKKEITKEGGDSKSLTMKDFDEIVAFWAR